MYKKPPSGNTFNYKGVCCMKKISKLKKIISMGLICTSMGVFSGCTSLKDNLNQTQGENKPEEVRVLDYNEVKDSLIRFHVIANSDSDEDQNLKLKVKDKVIDYLYPYLNSSKSLDESRQIIKDRMGEVKKIAEEVVQNNKYDYGVQVQLSRENFPDKSYGNIVLPQGNYEAFRIIIGSGQGKNWWCVMFPPLCFVDESKAEVEYDKTENRIKASQHEEEAQGEQETDESKSDNKEDKQNDIQIKFKILEILKEIFD